MKAYWLIPIGVIVALCSVPHMLRRLAQSHRIQSTALSENYSRLRDLSMLVNRAVLLRPFMFSAAVGNGLTNRFASIPAAIRTNIIDEADSAEANSVVSDSWGNSMNLIILPARTPRLAGQVRYWLKIWSNGPNGVDELGLGDDITSPQQQIPPD